MKNMTGAGAQVCMQDKTVRFAFIDIAKAIGILLVVFAHINIQGLTYQTIYSFHIPLFFVLAGMTFKRSSYKNFKHFLWQKTKRLLFPYLLYSIVTFLWFALVECETYEISIAWKEHRVTSFFQTFLAQGSDEFLYHNPALWFIPCLFVTETLYYLVSSLKKPAKIITCALLGVIGWLFTQSFLTRYVLEIGSFTMNTASLPWQAEVALVALPFMLVGNLMADGANRLKSVEDFVLRRKALSWIFVVLAIAALIGLTLLGEGFHVPDAKGHMSMGSKHLGNIELFPANPVVASIALLSLFYGGAILGSLMVITLSVLIGWIIRERVEMHRSWLVWLGERSYAVMAIHFPVKRRMVVLVGQAIKKWWPEVVRSGKGYTNYASNNMLPSLVAFVFTMILTLVIVISAESFSRSIKLPGKARNDRVA